MKTIEDLEIKIRIISDLFGKSDDKEIDPKDYHKNSENLLINSNIDKKGTTEKFKDSKNDNYGNSSKFIEFKKSIAEDRNDLIDIKMESSKKNKSEESNKPLISEKDSSELNKFELADEVFGLEAANKNLYDFSDMTSTDNSLCDIKIYNNSKDNILQKDETLINKSEISHLDNYWDISVLPYSYYLSKIRKGQNIRKYLYKASRAESLNILEISPRKMSLILTQIDLFLIRSIKPSDLLDSPLSISHMSNKNNGLTNFVSSLIVRKEYQRYFIKVLKHLKNLKNYNSQECITNAFLRHKLSYKILSAISTDFKSYACIKKYVEHHGDILIYPFDLFIKDIEDTNNNINNEDASMRFCRLVEMMVRLQNKQDGDMFKKIDKRKEHFLLYQIFINLYEIKIDDHEIKDEMFILYL
ncbi:hypothetical protein P3W45_001054 [Vairimorpha bombi]|jgi:hypothetical protein